MIYQSCCPNAFVRLFRQNNSSETNKVALSSENETLMRFPTNRVLPLLGTKSNIRLVLNEWIWDCVSRRYLPVMKPAQTGRSNEHRSDGDAPFVPYNGRFEYFGRMPLGGLPCVPGKSKSACVHGVFGRPCLPVMTSTACTAGPPVGGGVLSIHSTWKSCRKLFCLAFNKYFLWSLQTIIYIYIDYTYIFGINLVHISSLSTFWKGAGSSYRGWESNFCESLVRCPVRATIAAF